MKRMKSYRVSFDYTYEGYSGYDHKESSPPFIVKALNEEIAVKKAKRLFKAYCSYGYITTYSCISS